VFRENINACNVKKQYKPTINAIYKLLKYFKRWYKNAIIILIDLKSSLNLPILYINIYKTPTMGIQIVCNLSNIKAFSYAQAKII